jgi:hypothetical protein
LPGQSCEISNGLSSTATEFCPKISIFLVIIPPVFHLRFWPPRAWTICALEKADTETRLLVERPEFDSSTGKKIFSSSVCPEWHWGALNLVPELFPRPDIDHSRPSNAKLQNEWSYTPTAIIQHHVVNGAGVAIFILLLSDTH